jgi:hypothetical protein
VCAYCSTIDAAFGLRNLSFFLKDVLRLFKDVLDVIDGVGPVDEPDVLGHCVSSSARYLSYCENDNDLFE